MKTRFTKNIYGIVIILLLSPILIYGQLNCTNSISMVGGSFELQTPSGNLTISLTSQNGVIGLGSQSALLIQESNIFCPTALDPNATDFSFINSSVESVFNNAPISNLFRAEAGVPFKITLNASVPLVNAHMINPSLRYSSFTGSGNFHGPTSENYSVLPDFNIPSPNVYEISNIAFSNGTTRGYVILNIQIGGVTSLPSLQFSIILPFVVEGPVVHPGSNEPGIPILGTFKEPAIPQMILHNPPGDGSYVTLQTAQEACRSMSQSLITEESNAGTLNVTLGIAGSFGLFFTTDFEFSATSSSGVGGGSAEMKSSGQQNCVSILSTISTVPGTEPANEGSIYIGYSSDIAYGLYPIVTIKTLPTFSIEIDSSLIFGLVPNSGAAFYYKKSNILDDIAQKQTIINNPTTTPKGRHEAQNQINIWRQVLAKDSINIHDPNAEVIKQPFSLFGQGSSNSESVTQSVSSSETYDLSHFLELGVGVSFVAKVGGNGVDGGYEFKTKKTMGTSVSNTNNTSTTISYTLQDDDDGDTFKIKIIKDKTYGTPIFLLDSAQSRTSWPYEGGYPRDQPELRFSASPTSSTYTVPNVPVGQQSIFGINLCNNSNEARTYNLRFNPLSNANGAMIAITGTTGNTEFGPFLIAANSCYPSNFFAFVTQANPAILSSHDINLQLYALNDQSIASDIFATSNWGNYSFPTGISTGQINICQGVNLNIPLTANCAEGSVATWYNNAQSTVPIGTGSPFSQSPSTSTNYFVSCNSGIFNYKKFPAKSVVVNPSPTAPIITESGPMSFCEPGAVTLKSYLANDNKILNFIKTSNQYVVVPHHSSLNFGTTFTMEAWVNYSGMNSTIIDKGNYNFLWQLNANGNANKMGYFERNTGWKYSNDPIPQNTWTHVAITLQGGTLKFYINGVASGTAAVASAFQDFQPMNIGREQPTACVCNHFNGSMDELRLWNVAKSQAEIQASMNIGVPANLAGLVAYYKFNEASGNSVVDATSNGNNGILVNGPTRQTALTVPSNEVNALWKPINTTTSSITATTSGTFTATLTNGFGCSTSVTRVVSAGSNAAVISLTSPNDDFPMGSVLRTASSTIGRINASNIISGSSNVSYRAKSIELGPGFKAEKGTVFSAKVGGCVIRVPEDYPTLQLAVNNSLPNGKILINGNISESGVVTVNIPGLTIEGTGNSPKINGSSLTITAKDINVQNLHVNMAVVISGTSNTKLMNSTLSATNNTGALGVLILINSSNNEIKNCTIDGAYPGGSYEYGLFMDTLSNKNKVENCTSTNTFGTGQSNSSAFRTDGADNIMINCTALNFTRGFSSFSSYSNNNKFIGCVANNSINDAGFVIFFIPDGNSITFENCTANNNKSHGFFIAGGSCFMTNCTANFNSGGPNAAIGVFVLFGNFRIEKSTFKNNINTGIVIYDLGVGNHTGTLEENNTESNGSFGIYLWGANNLTISNNNAINNPVCDFHQKNCGVNTVTGNVFGTNCAGL